MDEFTEDDFEKAVLIIEHPMLITEGGLDAVVPFYATATCQWCSKMNGFYEHHLRRSQFDTLVVLCDNCQRWTRTMISYPNPFEMIPSIKLLPTQKEDTRG